jgi:hypothetical protein
MNKKERIEIIKQLIGLSNEHVEVFRIFETPRVGDEVDNGMGVDFELPQFAFFYQFKDEKTYRKGDKYSEFISRAYDLKFKREWDWHSFDMTGQSDNIKPLSRELFEMDGYKVIWKKNDIPGSDGFDKRYHVDSK